MSLAATESCYARLTPGSPNAGYDIHGHMEIKRHGKWLHYWHCDNAPRDFDVFARMANVCRDIADQSIEPISEPRGLPEDISETTRLCRSFLGERGRSDSYLTAKEILGFCLHPDRKTDGRDWFELWEKVLDKYFGTFFGESYLWLDQDFRDTYPEEIQNFRFVFWFDG